MVWKLLFPPLIEEGNSEKQKTEAGNDKEKKTNSILNESCNKFANAEKSQHNEKTETPHIRNRLSKPSPNVQLQSPANHCLQPLGNRRNSTVVGKTPLINPALKGRRRHSMVATKSTTSFGDSLELSNVQGSMLPHSRRFSGSTIAKLGVSEYGRNALRNQNTFKNLGDRIWKMIKVKNMFSSKDKNNDDEESQLFQYQEDGTRVEPRFTSSLSPEAQLAILKGYEDKNYEEILGLYPASKLLLKRSHTPVSILGDENGAWEKLRETKTKLNVMSAFSIHHDDELDSPLRLRKASASTIPNFAKLFQTDNRPIEKRRSNSLSILLPDDKRRILSYRMENAMDILDTLKNSKGQHTVSPRLKSYQNPIRPVKAYNKWSELWKTDFRSVKKSELLKENLESLKS